MFGGDMGVFSAKRFRVNCIFPILCHLWPKFSVLSSLETIDHIKTTGKSIVRFGDGEFDCMAGKKGPGYQKNSDKLRKRLLDVFNYDSDNLLICIPEVFQLEHLSDSHRTKDSQFFWKNYLVKNFAFLRRHLKAGNTYGNASLSRPYIATLNCEESGQIFDELKSIWQEKRVVVVEGEQTRFGVGNDLLLGAKSVSRIIAPSKNAFACYDEILQEAKKQPKDSIFILALGPTAKVLAMDLNKENYQVLDLGHLDIEYEWFLRKATERVTITNKYVNELSEKFVEGVRNGELEMKYQNEIISTIQ